ncbi:hypothetical protein PRIPAC_80611, partial [Pristionchus pacificus]
PASDGRRPSAARRRLPPVQDQQPGPLASLEGDDHRCGRYPGGRRLVRGISGAAPARTRRQPAGGARLVRQREHQHAARQASGPGEARRGDSRGRGGEDRGRDGGAGRASRRAEKNGSLSTVGIDYCSCDYGRF